MSFRDQTRTESAKSVDLLRCLDCFLQVAETGNMTATARIMRLTQSAVSQQIQTLETIVGASLFDRNLRPLKMTKEGRLLYDVGRIVATDEEHGDTHPFAEDGRGNGQQDPAAVTGLRIGCQRTAVLDAGQAAERPVGQVAGGTAFGIGDETDAARVELMGGTHAEILRVWRCGHDPGHLRR